MKAILLCALAVSAPALVQDTGVFPLDAVKDLGGWAVVAGVLVYQTKQYGGLLNKAVEQNTRVLEAIEELAKQLARRDPS